MEVLDTKNIRAEDRSYAIYQLLGNEPNGLIRYGILFMAIIVSVLFSFTFIIKYPDVIQSKFSLSSINSPRKIISNSSGKLKLLVHNGDHVHSGDIVGILDNPSNFEDVFRIKDDVGHFLTLIKRDQRLEFNLASDTYQLGELQPYYEELIRSVETYKMISELNKSNNQIRYLRNQILFLEKLRFKLNEQERLSKSEYTYNSKRVKIDSLLYIKKVLSKSEYERSQQDNIQYEKAVSLSRQNSIQNEIRISQLYKEITDYDFSTEKETRNVYMDIIAKANTLASSISSWEDRFLFKSTIAGEISLTRIWKSGDNINSGDEILSVIPTKNSSKGLAVMPASGVGKVRVGQKVIITFDGFKKDEFGSVVGQVSEISSVPINGTYLVTVNLNKGLRTTYNKYIEYRPELTGNAEIITADLKLADRMFNQIRMIFHKD